MVTGREWSAESGAGLAVGHIGVGEEQAGLSGESIGNLTCLADKAVLHLHGVVDATAVTNNRVLTDDTRADEHWGIHRRHYGTLRQARGAANLAVALDDGVGDVFGIDNLHVVADDATLRACHPQFVLNHLLKRLSQFLVTIILYHEGGQLGIQLTEDSHVAVAHLVEHRNHRSFAIGGIVRCLQRADVRDIAVVTNGVVVDVVTHLFYQAVVAHGDVTQSGIVDARMFKESFCHLYGLVELTQTDVTIEYDAVEIIGFEAFGHLYTLPVLSPADIVFQYLNFYLCQLSVVTHSLDIRNRYTDISVRAIRVLSCIVRYAARQDSLFREPR